MGIDTYRFISDIESILFMILRIQDMVTLTASTCVLFLLLVLH
jgi:hypothetical protein